MSVFFGLTLIKDQWRTLASAIFASFLILILDFLLTTGMPKIITGLNLVLVDGKIEDAPLETIVLTVLIVFRPILGWLINLYQINLILRILRNLEDQICRKAARKFQDDQDYLSEAHANMVISHGRYFVDAYLIPMIRALTDIGSIVVISIGLSLQFPIPLALFIASITIVLALYQGVVGNILSNNGKLLLNSYEKIITLSRSGFTERMKDQDLEINNTLDEKKRASLALASISQGLKYVIEFCFMFSFGVVSIFVAITSPESFVVFLSTFAYAGVRMLPSFTTILGFTQGKTSAEHPIKELSKMLNT